MERVRRLKVRRAPWTKLPPAVEEEKRQPESETTTSAAAAKFMSVVGDDLLLEIILRLPDYKTITQCGSVCKRWLSLVSSCFELYLIHKFNHNHHHKRSNSQLPYTLFIRDFFRYPRYLYPDTLSSSHHNNLFSNACKILHHGSPEQSYLNCFDSPDTFIIASFDDLLLVQHAPSQFSLCNPLTKQSVALPEPPTPHSKPPLYRCGLVCEPNCCTNKSYFCNCRIKYKVVLVRSWDESDSVFYVAVFDSVTGEWNESTFEFPVKLHVWHCGPVGCNGTVYFAFGGFEMKGILAFDVFEEERRRLITLPVVFRHKGSDYKNERIGVVRGRLRLFQTSWNRRFNYFVVTAWELVDDESSSWVLAQRFRLKMRQPTLKMSVMALHPEEDDVFYFACHDHDPDHDHEYVCQYENGKDHLQYVCEIPTNTKGLLRFQCLFPIVHPWWPTLIPALP